MNVPAARRTPVLPRTARGRFGAALVAAATAVTLGAGVATLTHQAGASDAAVPPAAPASQPSLPAPGVAAAAATSSLPAVAPSTGSATVAPTTGGPTAAALHPVTLGGVTVQVPVTWEPAATSGAPVHCLTLGGVAEQVTDDGLTTNCQLSWIVGTDLGTPDPDAFRVFGNGPLGCHVRTVAADDATVGGQPAEHRVFAGDCLDGTREQWTVPTTPVVVFSTDTTDTTDAAAAVRTATLPDRTSTTRLVDTGFGRSATPDTLWLDRVSAWYGNTVVVHDENPTSYPYALSPSTTVTANGAAVPLDQFLDMVNRSDYDAVGIGGVAWLHLTTDDGVVTTIDLQQGH